MIKLRFGACALSLTCFVTILWSNGCGTSTGTGNITDFSRTSPNGSVVASATAGANGGSAYLDLQKRMLFSEIGTAHLLRLIDLLDRKTYASTTPGDDLAPASVIVAEMKADLAAAPATTAALVNLNFGLSYSDCYGPAWTDKVKTTSTNRALGDLGMVAASALNGEACAASELNTMFHNFPRMFNSALRLNIALITAATDNGEKVPGVGSTLTFKSADYPTITGAKFTVTGATIERMSNDSLGNAVYKTVITMDKGSFTFWHNLLSADNTSHIGLAQIVLTDSGAITTQSMGMSVVYHNDGTTTTLLIEVAMNKGSNSTDFFNSTTGRVDFTKSAYGQNGNKILISMKPSTNEGTVHAAWEGTAGDGSTRDFAANVSLSSGTLTGVAYYGFGPDMTSVPDTTTTIWPTKMSCNWTGSGTNNFITGLQGQQFSQSASTGRFVATTSHIDFAPTDTCDCPGGTSSWSVTGDSNSSYNTTYNTCTHDFTTAGALGAIPAVTVPSFTIPAN